MQRRAMVDCPKSIEDLWKDLADTAPTTDEEKYTFYMGALATFIAVGNGATPAILHDEVRAFFDEFSGRGSLQ